jgi:hypothetical protein
VLKSQVIALAVGMPNRPKLTPNAHANIRVRVFALMTHSDPTVPFAATKLQLPLHENKDLPPDIRKAQPANSVKRFLDNSANSGSYVPIR